MVILSKISERLTDLKNEAQLKPSEIAKQTGLSTSVISRILNRERMPSYRTLIVLADFFNCSVDYLVGEAEDWNETTFKPCPPFNEQLDFLLKYFNISKYRFEKDTGLAEETVNRWHQGKYKPTVDNLITIAKHYNCSVDFILGRTDY